MADFHQNGGIATLHRLRSDGRVLLERELEQIAGSVSIGLVLTALYSEFQNPAMRQMASELKKVRYLRRIVVALGRASYEEYQHACTFFRDFPCQVTVLWIDSEPMQDFLQQLTEAGLSAGADGKGRSCWLSYGFLQATGDCDVIALHDCDIRNYDQEMLARLCYPVAHPGLDYEFCKGYYARVTDRMHGRVTRLFMAPLIRSLEALAPNNGFMRFLDSFRYPLAGEFAMKSSVARLSRIPSDWGLEIGMLSEVYRNCSPRRTCQVDLADNYDHKHQMLSAGDPSQGLRRMACDIGKAMFRYLAAEGVSFGTAALRTLQVLYLRTAQDMIRCYQADAIVNGLRFDLNCEEAAVDAFAHSLKEAAHAYMHDPVSAPLIPNWNRIQAAIPDVSSLLLDAVDRVQDQQLALSVA